MELRPSHSLAAVVSASRPALSSYAHWHPVGVSLTVIDSVCYTMNWTGVHMYGTNFYTSQEETREYRCLLVRVLVIIILTMHLQRQTDLMCAITTVWTELDIHIWLRIWTEISCEQGGHTQYNKYSRLQTLYCIARLHTIANASGLKYTAESSVLLSWHATTYTVCHWETELTVVSVVSGVYPVIR